jgi:hypothetical protein
MRTFEHGAREEIDLSVEMSPSPYITQTFSEKNADAVLIPVVESNRRHPGCEKNPVLVFHDNCGAYCSYDVLTKPAGMASL